MTLFLTETLTLTLAPSLTMTLKVTLALALLTFILTLTYLVEHWGPWKRSKRRCRAGSATVLRYGWIELNIGS